MKDLILFGGQSNMQGQTERLAESSPVPGAMEYRYLTDSLIPLRDPCGEDIRADGTEGYPYSSAVSSTWHGDNVLGSSCDGHTTLLPEFCRAYIRHAPEHPEVTAVHGAKGSTDMKYWLPGTDGYRILTAKAKAARAKSGGIRNTAMVWLQGESDAIYGISSDDYAAMLSGFGHALAKDLGLNRFGIIRVGRFTRDERDLAVMEGQDRLCREDSLFVMLTRAASDFCTMPEYCEYMNPHVGGHYSAAGLQKLGSLAGEALARQI